MSRHIGMFVPHYLAAALHVMHGSPACHSVYLVTCEINGRGGTVVCRWGANGNRRVVLEAINQRYLHIGAIKKKSQNET